MNKVFVSHKSHDWRTPIELYDLFRVHGAFDPCPLDHDGFDAFFIEWGDLNFVNPPYSDIARFVEKAFVEHAKGKDVFLLVSARTSSKWFAKLYRYGCHFFFIQGRLRFGGSKSPAPFDSVLVKLIRGRQSMISLYSYFDLIDYLEKYQFGYCQGGGI